MKRALIVKSSNMSLSINKSISITRYKELFSSVVYQTIFILSRFSFKFITIPRTAGEGEGYFFNSSLTVSRASQALRHQPTDYCTQLTSSHSQQSDTNRKPLVSKSKLHGLSRSRGLYQVETFLFFHVFLIFKNQFHVAQLYEKLTPTINK